MSSISDEKKLHQRLKTLSDVFLLPTSKPLDYKSIIRTVTKHFKIFTEADASVLMLNNNNENLTPVFSIGIPFSKIKDSTLPLSTRLKDIVSRPVLDMRYSSFMNTPLIHNRKLIGLSAVFSITPEKFHTFERDKYNNLLLTILASYFPMSIYIVTQAAIHWEILLMFWVDYSYPIWKDWGLEELYLSRVSFLQLPLQVFMARCQKSLRARTRLPP